MTPKLPRLLSQWLANSTPRTIHKTAKPNAFRPLVECLEARTVPAGGVTAVKSGSTLTVTGDNLDNDIVITGASGSYTVTGNDTTVTGGPAFTGITAIKVVLKEGNDRVALTADSLATITIDGGNGDNTANIVAGAVTSTLSITNGTGYDNTTVAAPEGSDLTLKTVTIKNGNGGSATYITNSNVGMKTTITGAFTATNGDGYDGLFIGFGSGSGSGSGSGYSSGDVKLNSVTIKNGDGGSQTFIGRGYYYYGYGSGDSDISITGTLDIKNGAGEDGIYVGDGYGYGSGYYGGSTDVTLNTVKIDNGNGAGSGSGSGSGSGGSYTYFSAYNGSLTVNGALNILNGTGYDYNLIASFGDNSKTTLKSVSINNGDGGSSNYIYAYGDNAALTITGATTITNGTGWDDNYIGSVQEVYETLQSITDEPFTPAVTKVGSVTINNGASGSITNLGVYTEYEYEYEYYYTLAPEEFGAITVTGAAGDDYVFLNSIAAKSTVNINLGADDDHVGIYGSSFAGKVTIDTGIGNDYVGIEDGEYYGSFESGTTFTAPGLPFSPALTILLGEGDDVLQIGGYESPGVSINGYSKFDGGPGYDEFYHLYDNVQLPANMTTGFEFIGPTDKKIPE